MITTLYFAYHIIKIYSIRKSAYLISEENEPDLYRQYSKCLNELRIRRKVSLYASCNMSSPVSYGLLHPKVIIPQDMDILYRMKMYGSFSCTNLSIIGIKMPH